MSSPNGGGGGGSGAFPYTKAVALDNKELRDSGVITQQLKLKERVRIKIANAVHHIGIREISTTSATVEISSDPVKVALDIGEDAKIDVNHDKYYDVYVKLNSITNGKADLNINYLNELIKDIDRNDGVETTGEIVDDDKEEPVMDDPSNNNVLIIVVAVVILLGLVFWIIKRRS